MLSLGADKNKQYMLANVHKKLKNAEKSHGQVFFLNFAMYHEQIFPCFFQVQENS